MATTKVMLTTDIGDIVLEVFIRRAPATAAFFLELIDTGKYDGASFYRATDTFANSAVQTKILQGGIMYGLISGTSETSLQEMGVRPLKTLESTNQTQLKHRAGTVSFARDLAASGYVLPDIFICFEESPQFDVNGRTEPDTLGFPAFAQVVQGMHVASQISSGATNGPTHIDTMRGQILTDPVKIIRAARL